MRYLSLAVSLAILSSCSSHNPPGPAPSFSMNSAANPASYAPRVGVAVTTGSRSCVAIKNANLTVGSPVTVVSPLSPQSFAQAQVSAVSTAPCPISKEVDPAVSNYDLKFAAGSTLPKMTPLIAVVGSAGAFSVAPNGNVSANLDQDNKTESFRACSASDGLYLTVWSGNQLDGTLLWHGYYYEPGNSGAGPACTPKETNPVS